MLGYTFIHNIHKNKLKQRARFGLLNVVIVDFIDMHGRLR